MQKEILFKDIKLNNFERLNLFDKPETQVSTPTVVLKIIMISTINVKLHLMVPLCCLVFSNLIKISHIRY